ncbi:TadE/TadG family type IV pilus assembly protein [Demequina oxidasica]|uniref:TadE/TadG family type IV pilus assembly protein n=1 Tax=Demequina oxidasica TaxID=676199 RepID=UPI001364C165|nr:TadE/TadG family type IV pilus assembly protein [Demequina oxidasica]
MSSAKRQRYGGGPVCGNRRERGSVSVELALALPSVVLVLGFVLTGASWVRAEVSATQAAAVAARIALTDGDAAAVDAAIRISGGVASVSRDGAWVVVSVIVEGQGPVPDGEATARVPVQP